MLSDRRYHAVVQDGDTRRSSSSRDPADQQQGIAQSRKHHVRSKHNMSLFKNIVVGDNTEGPNIIHQLTTSLLTLPLLLFFNRLFTHRSLTSHLRSIKC
jgi:hypothetical protein